VFRARRCPAEQILKLAPRRGLSQGDLRTVGAQEIDFTELNETAIGGVGSP
jgi:hypothetical protein